MLPAHLGQCASTTKASTTASPTALKQTKAAKAAEAARVA